MNTRDERNREVGRGRDAEWPRQIPFPGWKDILLRVWREVNEDRVMLVAAGATFYLLLALFPALAAFVSLYGFVADPTTIADHISYLGGLLPSASFDLIRGQLEALANQEREALSFGFILAFLVALWSANTGVKTLFQALNIAYEERETRGFVALNLLSVAFTLGVMAIGVLLVLSVGVIPALLAFLHLDSATDMLVRFVRWPITLIAIAIGITAVYRFGPSRRAAKWRWLSWGGTLATVVWIAASLGFSFYLQNFADYNATYGSLGAVIGFMMWTWISVMILLVGAEINAEMERQTACDSTIGVEQPMGERQAVVADTLGISATERARVKNDEH